MLLVACRGTMDQVGQRSLIFHIGDIGFLLDYQYIVEILGRVGDTFDFSRSDLQNNIVAAIEFRKTLIPVFDPGGFLLESRGFKTQEKTTIVLHGTEGNWALIVDKVDELTGHEALMPCAIPDLLKLSSKGYYSDIRLINDKPYVVFEPENFYGAVVAKR